MFWTASLLFFVSGATGLAYEVIWFKRFAHVWGSSSVALAAVVASFLCGLGIGAHLIGRRADDLEQPIRWYGWAELGIGLLALLVPWELHLLALAGAPLDSSLPLAPALRFVAQFFITLLVIGPPCILMGGTLPLLVRQFSAADQSLAESTGWFYALNTFGAAAGCLLSGFLLLPTWGLVATNNLTAAGNLLVGWSALRLARRRGPAKKASAAPAPAKKANRSAAALQSLAVGRAGEPVAAQPLPEEAVSTLRVYAAAALAGAAALILQIVWNRQLAVTLGGSTYAFSSTLFVVLFSIALGSLLYHWRLRPWGHSPYLLAAVIFAIALGVLAGRWAWPALCQWAGAARAARANPVYNAWLCIAIGSVMQLIPSLGGGVLFPLLAQWTRERGASAGRIIGNLYAWNTVGAILGATCTGLALFPTIGTSGATALALALYTAALLVLHPISVPGAPWKMLGYAGVGMACALVALRAGDPRRTNFGMYLYGVMSPQTLTGHNLLMFREGQSSNVMVAEQRGVRSLRVNGKVDASTGLDMQTQLGLAYFSRMFQPDAREVAVIGFGSGVTSGASLQFAGTNVVCCEIEPAVYEAAPLFGEVNHKPHENPNFQLVVADGRSYLQNVPGPFDLIISEPSNPWLAGVSNLFTRDFFLTVRQRLAERGVLVQWVQTYNFSLSEYALILRTMRAVFPHVTLLSLAGGADTLLVASPAPLEIDADAADHLQALVEGSPVVADDLDTQFGTHDVRSLLLRHHALDNEGIERLLKLDGGQTINTDVNMRLEFDAPLRLFQPQQDLAHQVQYTIANLRTAGWIEGMAGRMGMDRNSAACRLAVARLTRDKLIGAAPRERPKLLEETQSELERARKADPNDLEVLAELGSLQVLTGKSDQALKTFQSALESGLDNARVNGAIGSLLLTAGRKEEAVGYLERSAKLDPYDTTTLNNLAWILSTSKSDALRNGQRALELAQRACAATNYAQAECLDTMAAALAEVGRFDEAVTLENRAAGLMRQAKRDVKELDARLEKYKARQPIRE